MPNTLGHCVMTSLSELLHDLIDSHDLVRFLKSLFCGPASVLKPQVTQQQTSLPRHSHVPAPQTLGRIFVL